MKTNKEEDKVDTLLTKNDVVVDAHGNYFGHVLLEKYRLMEIEAVSALFMPSSRARELAIFGINVLYSEEQDSLAGEYLKGKKVKVINGVFRECDPSEDFEVRDVENSFCDFLEKGTLLELGACYDCLTRILITKDSKIQIIGSIE